MVEYLSNYQGEPPPVYQIEKYVSFLRKFPTPGGGGAHRAIYVAGCMGAEAGIDEDQVKKDIRLYIPNGSRHVPGREIDEGVKAAFEFIRTGEKRSKTSGPIVAPMHFYDIARKGHGATMEDIIQKSPIKLTHNEKDILPEFLEAIAAPDEIYFFGDDTTPGMVGQSICKRDEWIERLRKQGANPWPKWIPNPLTGKYAPKKSGNGFTNRGDGSVAALRFVVVEHDRMPLQDQIAFWAACPLPVAALIFSGKKSIHGLIRVDCNDAADWQANVSQKLYDRYLIPMGFDSSCQNPSRLSRAPGHKRPDTDLIQSCIYLCPTGKAVMK